MNGEIKVTVIATGFDSHVQMIMPQPRNMELQAAAGAGTPGFVPGLVNKNEDIEVPTFIRRKAD
jgi:hypothetical protein